MEPGATRNDGGALTARADGDALLHPAQYRWSIRAAALVAMGTWWGLGLPYSLYAWLLDSQQLHWVLICYGWEVPACGFIGPFLFPMLWFRDVERRWDRVFGGERVDVGAAMALERTLLDYPMRVAAVLLITSLVGYGVGALQLRWFAQLPVDEVVKIILLGLATGMVGALFAFLYLEWLLAPLLRSLGMVHAVAPTSGRRVPLYAKVFACSLILTVTALLLLGTVFYSRGERVLEEQVGLRLTVEARHLAEDIAGGTVPRGGQPPWQGSVESMQLGRSGYVRIVDTTGAIVGGPGSGSIAADGFRPMSVAHMLSNGAGYLVDRVYEPRIVAFTPIRDTSTRIIAVAYRHEFAGELQSMLARGGVVFLMALVLALSQGFLFSRRLTRPIEIVTEMATTITHAPGGSWAIVPVRTNDEVGELATAFNQMTTRLEEARGALERYSVQLEQRVAEATRNIASLYDVARATTSTLEPDDVLKMVAEKTLATLGLSRLVLLWYPPEAGEAVDAYATSADGSGERLELSDAVDLVALCPSSSKPTIVETESVTAIVPARIAAAVSAGPYTLTLPLVFKEQLLGVVLAGLGSGEAPAPDLDLAAALANQAAAALANAALFETVRRHEVELRKLTDMRMQLQEETLRSLSRELHDGVGQVLTAIKMDLGMLERSIEAGDDGHRERVREIREQVTDLVQEIRNMSQLLRPSMLDDFGLVPTLQWLTEKFSARTNIAVDLQTPDSDLRLPSAIEVALYRVTQEALTNVMKHAQAHRVEIELRVRDDEVALTIADDGVGFDVERFRRTPALGGVGLLGMRERVAHYRGRVDIAARPTGGVRITLTLPLDAAAGGPRGIMPLAG